MAAKITLVGTRSSELRTNKSGFSFDMTLGGCPMIPKGLPKPSEEIV
ncbi:hypothetical protein NZD89_28995 (plasmid) [Alicyclobacillus fastidiosus]|uniref:Uncharacterized protein n=1 Tax=Alicyclobacillus fastidiosus TaxID=392011 RepID=A0ABY6ZRG7_9BACL|nr:hypothetical protein [Alicyclobacillus fastidiosus]WAH45022.1 hypothetical protein NZD89_28995 [Alicyclobacillus fastidiosus]GMA66233.1 hypothetical protein GCM10025859_66750 [Alicyclobacillus fastidiosus]